MDNSNKLAILGALARITDCSIIKLSQDFPGSMRDGGDIDILSVNMESSVASLLLYLRNIGLFSVVVHKSTSFSHVDLYSKSKFIHRFDIVQSFSHFKRLNVKKRFILDLVENSCDKIISFQGQEFAVKVPNLFYECLMRLMEYSEYYWVGPDKVQHLSYILDSSVPSSKYFCALHDYTSISEELTLDNGATQFDRFKGDVSKLLFAYKSLPVRLWPKKTYQLIIRALGG